MARILCLSKYPPIEGGISSKTYWLCRALAKKGHALHIVTDKTDVSPDYTYEQAADESEMENITVHRPQRQLPWHVPDDTHRALELLNLALQVIDDYGADVIDTGYLIPYGIAGYLASQITGVPFIIRHGGSDIEKFLKGGIWSSLFRKAFAGANIVITDKGHLETVSKIAENTIVLHSYVPDPSEFNPKSRSSGKRAVFALIGKANYHWRHKGWHRAIEIMKHLGDGFKYKFIIQGKGYGSFKQYIGNNFNGDIEWQSFLHPHQMPEILRTVNGVFIMEQDMPYPVFSNLFVECLYSGTTVITDKPDSLEFYEKEGVNLEPFSQNVIVIPENDAMTAAQIILDHFEQKNNKETFEFSMPVSDNYQAYISGNEDAILSVIR